jgi:hypothetical protein
MSTKVVFQEKKEKMLWVLSYYGIFSEYFFNPSIVEDFDQSMVRKWRKKTK